MLDTASLWWHLCRMLYRTLGGTDLRVSVIGVGTWQFGGEWGRDYSQADTDVMLDAAAADLVANE
jgi:aryl-alcohol dehydrogenase-like predicted oxidoreductase